MKNTHMNIDKMTETAVMAAIDAGKAILDIYALDFEVETKSDNSPLTEADKASHEIIIKALENTPFPVLSEESDTVAHEERMGWETYWLVDPLDGTKEFIRKNGEFTVNIALIRDGKPVLGVVFAPVLDSLYCGLCEAESGKSAWKTDECAGKSYDELRQEAASLSISNFPQSAHERKLRVVASRSHCNEETQAFISALEQEYGPAERVSKGSSLKLCMVAEGSADIYPRIAPTMEWDTAAAHAVVTAAGGSVYEYDRGLSVDAYSRHDAKAMAHGGTAENTLFQAPCALRYNKQNLLNPYFVVSGLSKKW